MVTKDIQIIGRVVKLSVIDGDISDISAKIDTGAYSSSIWASYINVSDDGILSFRLLGPSSPHYNGKTIKTTDFKTVIIENSFGHKERRYSVILNVIIEGRKVRSRFTLANRRVKSYPALIGRRLLNKRFVVDVSRINAPAIKANWSK